MSESNLWTWLKRAREHYGKDLRMRRVENMAETGGPDVDGVVYGDPFWIELKACARPARGGILRYHTVTVQQVEWHSDQQAAGGASAFLIQVGAGPSAERYLVHGGDAQRLADGVTEEWLYINATRMRDAVSTLRCATLLISKNRFPNKGL